MTERRRRRAAGALSTLLLAGSCAIEPPGPPERVHIPPGASFAQIADSLADRDIVHAPMLFRLYARLIGADDDVKAGTYGFRRGEAWNEILRALRLGDSLTDRLVIPEGWDIVRIAPGLATLTGTPPDSVVALLFDSAYAARFGVPGPTLEGYLYPATYTFPAGIPLDTIVSRLVAAYRAAWTAERRARADSMGMTEREVVTLASIVEKEAKQRDEMPMISAVYHNRLRRNYPLQADPTVQYALGEHQSRLLYAHIDSVADHPYNTYRNVGLPPGPIGSPSGDAIDAALRPAQADYFYFVADPAGHHIFTRTLDEHNAARARLRQAARAERDSSPRP